MLVADTKAEVEHERHVALRREAGGVVDRPRHARVHADAAARVVGDLEPDQLRAGCDAVKAAHVEEVVSGGDAGDVGAVARRIEEQIERRRAILLVEVGDQRQRFRPQRDRLATLAIVVQGHLILERAVEIRIEERHPAIRRFDDDHREGIGVAAIAVDVARGGPAEGQLAERAAVPGRGRGQPSDTGRAPLLALHGSGECAQGDTALARKVAQLDHLGRAGARGDQPRDARIEPAVENRDQGAAAVIGGMSGAEDIGAGALQGHEAQHVGDRRLDCRLGRAAPVCRLGPWLGRRGRPVLLRDRRGGRCPLTGGAGGREGGDNSEQRQLHERLGSAKAPRCGPVNSVDTSSRKASVSRVSSGVRMASTNPRAPANLASSCCS